ncbi:MAG: aminopeptidase N [Bdellovibrionaceae bacterium]|nr:aminopeptidase N [Pseudobdellovibrionaceae bacterium]
MNKKIHLKDYLEPNFWISKVELFFDIFDTHTIVVQKSLVKKNTNTTFDYSSLHLQGEELKLLSVLIDGKIFKDYSITDNELILKNLESLDTFNLEIQTKIYPHKNTKLTGLYKSGDLLCTQCEAEGFRHITYFLDRPDNMAIFTVHITADKTKYPVLLSNGNKIEEKKVTADRHLVSWQDPFKKPSYLFALVAGNLDHIHDQFTTKSNKKITLEIYSEKNKSHLCHYAMECLKKAMKWDEDTYNLEYDLNRFMIVAVDDFNMGAMENKGLNIFNSRVILSNPEMATDKMLDVIESIIGHEYFHNWSGNRVTCRDWFQLSLKEGLTVYRDQEFSSDLNDRSVERIQNVNRLRMRQFAEDAGPNSHPVRPFSYLSIDNFYTATVYEKGAELIRMIHLILGEQKFKAGIAKYFALFDGTAAAIEDFLFAMEQASNISLKQFKKWYEVPGTPTLKLSTNYLQDKHTLEVNIQQSYPSIEKNGPLHIPILIQFLIPEEKNDKPPKLIELKKEKETFVFTDLAKKPTISFLQNFSAPVKVEHNQTPEELMHIMEKDVDLFNKWNSSQILFTQNILNHYDKQEKTKFSSIQVDTQILLQTFEKNLKQATNKPLFFTELLTLPNFSYLTQFIQDLNPLLLQKEIKNLIGKIAAHSEQTLLQLYKNLISNFQEKPNRALLNLCLYYLNHLDKPEYTLLANQQVTDHFNNMTLCLSGLNALNLKTNSYQPQALEKFYDRWKNDTIVFNDWIQLKMSYPSSDLKKECEGIFKNSYFKNTNPNHLGALMSSFTGHIEHFHKADGSGYEYTLQKIIDIDKVNPQAASVLINQFNIYSKLNKKSQEQISLQLLKIKKQNPSKNLIEKIDNLLV